MPEIDWSQIDNPYALIGVVIFLLLIIVGMPAVKWYFDNKRRDKLDKQISDIDKKQSLQISTQEQVQKTQGETQQQQANMLQEISQAVEELRADMALVKEMTKDEIFATDLIDCLEYEQNDIIEFQGFDEVYLLDALTNGREAVVKMAGYVLRNDFFSDIEKNNSKQTPNELLLSKAKYYLRPIRDDLKKNVDKIIFKHGDNFKELNSEMVFLFIDELETEIKKILSSFILGLKNYKDKVNGKRRADFKEEIINMVNAVTITTITIYQNYKKK